MKQLKTIYDQSIQRLGQFTQSVATILWRKLPSGLRVSLATSTPFYICLDPQQIHLVDRNIFLEDGISNSLLVEFIPTGLYFAYKDDGPVVIDYPLMNPEQYTREKVELIQEKFSQIKGILNES